MSRLAEPRDFRPDRFTASNFCGVFDQDMHILYSLALLLTGENKAAEQCFALALKQCVEGPSVFSGWERSWSRRAIVKQALQLVRPKAGDSDEALASLRATHDDMPSLLLQLQPFDRFVFAMTVLEGYAVREAAALLNTVPSQVEKARIRVFEAIGRKHPAIPPVEQRWIASGTAGLGATA